MRRLSLEELSAQAESVDARALATPGIDHFCSSSSWIIPAAEALMSAREPWIFAGEESYWAFMRGTHPDGFKYLEPLEAMWGLACPLLGARCDVLADGLEELCAAPREAWLLMAIAGIPAGGTLFASVVSRLASRNRIGVGPSAQRLVVDLREGVDAYLGRRSRNFRKSLRQSERRARDRGVTIEDASSMPADQLFLRIMRVEEQSWKGRAGEGICEGPMHEFYKAMLPRLSAHSRARVLFARRGPADLAYIFGAVFNGSYRGLQFSYDWEHRELALGNLLQIEQIRRLCGEGLASYDLGMDMEYKKRWADSVFETVTLLVLRN